MRPVKSLDTEALKRLVLRDFLLLFIFIKKFQVLCQFAELAKNVSFNIKGQNCCDIKKEKSLDCVYLSINDNSAQHFVETLLVEINDNSA